MTALRIAAAASVALALAACSFSRPNPQANNYVVEPPQPAVAPADARRPETLRMGNVRVTPAFANNELVYRMDDLRFTTDFYNRFIAPPGPMLGARMAEWLNRAGPFTTVAQPGSAALAPYVLEAVVTDLYGDFRPGRPAAAVITVQFYLLDVTGTTPTVVLERSIGRRLEIAQASPEALVRGYSNGLGEILAELSSQLGRGGAR